jgi:AcrR family transcriptional regulator
VDNFQADKPDTRTRLLQAALECFLADEYHKVSTRKIAGEAGTNVSMIRYYFGSKEGLFEETIREVLSPLLDNLDERSTPTVRSASELLQRYYRVLSEHEAFPRLVLKILAMNQAPGKSFVLRLLERGRSKASGALEKFATDVPQALDMPRVDVVRIAFVSLAITPMLLKDVFEEQMGAELDEVFLRELAEFNGQLLGSLFETRGKD